MLPLRLKAPNDRVVFVDGMQVPYSAACLSRPVSNGTASAAISPTLRIGVSCSWISVKPPHRACVASTHDAFDVRNAQLPSPAGLAMS